MPVKVAISSADGKMVHQHFGQTTQFVVCEVDGRLARFLEVRPNRPPCGSADDDGGGHDCDSMGRTIALIADCRAVICAQVGTGAVARLAEQGIQAFVIPDFIESALARLIDSGALDEPVQQRKRWLEDVRT